MARKVQQAQTAIEDKVAAGQVLNGEGRWVNISEQLANDQRAIEELSRGNVHVRGIWARIADAKKWAAAPPAPRQAAAPPPIAPSAPPQTALPPAAPITAKSDAGPVATMSFEAEDNLLETISMDASVISQIAQMGASSAKATFNADETDTFSTDDFSVHSDMCETTMMTFDRNPPPEIRG